MSRPRNFKVTPAQRRQYRLDVMLMNARVRSAPVCFVPMTPGGTFCDWLRASSEDEAWAKLLVDAAHMPYGDKAGFIARGYTVEKMRSF